MNNIENKFYETYSKIVLPKLKTLEPQRQNMVNILIFKEILLFFNVILFAYIAYKFELNNIFAGNSYISPISGTLHVIFAFFIFPGIVIASAMGMHYVFGNAVEKFKKLIKTACAKDFEKELSVKWSSKNTRKNLPFEISDIFPAYNKIEYDDTINGKYVDTEFDVQEIKMIMEGSKDRRKVFQGIVICIPSNKTVNAQTIITSKRDTAIRNRIIPIPLMISLGLVFLFIGTLGLKMVLSGELIHSIFKAFIHSIIAIVTAIVLFVMIIAQIKNERRLQKVKLEDLEFDKKFNINSENQIEARYLVTTTFMDRLQNLQTAFGTKNIKCSFFDDKVMFAISTNKDLFEIGNLFVPLTDKKQINAFIRELISIYNIIDYFKLTEKTGL